MSTSTLDNQLRDYLSAILPRPQMWAGTPEEAEGIITTILATLVAFESECSLSDALKAVYDQRRELVQDVPHAPNQLVLLCEETAIPERRSSFNALRQRAPELCRRVLKRLPDPDSQMVYSTGPHRERDRRQ